MAYAGLLIESCRRQTCVWVHGNRPSRDRDLLLACVAEAQRAVKAGVLAVRTDLSRPIAGCGTPYRPVGFI
jgi:hypothetical protein